MTRRKSLYEVSVCNSNAVFFLDKASFFFFGNPSQKTLMNPLFQMCSIFKGHIQEYLLGIQTEAFVYQRIDYCACGEQMY